MLDDATAHYAQREVELTPKVMREVERQVMLRIIDQRWREHLEEMDYLKEGINLRAMGQKDPLVEWQREGFEMFGKMMKGIAQDFVRYVMHVQVVRQDQQQPAAPAAPAVTNLTQTSSDDDGGSGFDRAAAMAPPAEREQVAAAASPTAVAPAPAPAAAPANRQQARQQARQAPRGAQGAAATQTVPKQETVVKDDWAKTPRNAPCPCGSGKKFKLCHGQ